MGAVAMEKKKMKQNGTLDVRYPQSKDEQELILDRNSDVLTKRPLLNGLLATKITMRTARQQI